MRYLQNKHDPLSFVQSLQKSAHDFFLFHFNCNEFLSVQSAPCFGLTTCVFSPDVLFEVRVLCLVMLFYDVSRILTEATVSADVRFLPQMHTKVMQVHLKQQTPKIVSSARNEGNHNHMFFQESGPGNVRTDL